MKRPTFKIFHLIFAAAFLGLLAIPAAGQLVYETNATPPTIFAPGATISLPNVAPGQTSSLAIRIMNNSPIAVATVSSIASSGASFSLTQVPALPANLGPGASIVFTINFAPTQAGAATGSLVINSDTLLLSGSGTAAQLVFSYQAAGTTITIGPANTSVVFSPVAVGATERIVFNALNNGTLPIVISNIGVGAPVQAAVGQSTTNAFTLSGLPSLPTTVAPGANFSFTISFQPSILGFSNAVLQLDTNSVPLLGSGTAPASIPSYTIAQSATGTTLTPKTQPTVSLTLSKPYAVALSGVLTLTVSGSLPADPAVQFSTGGRTVPFTIAANATNAIFGPTGATVGTAVGFQTGTVADTLTFSPTFATLLGAIDVTPAPPSTLQLSVPASLPSLTGVQLTAAAANGFSIAVTGYSTTRNLSSFNVQFGLNSGFTMPQTQFKVDLTSASNIWFQSTASQAFGGQFIVTVPFTFNGTLPSGTSIQNAFTSVSVSVTDDQGGSNTVQTAVQ